jgi:hypothetical protein
MALTGYSEGAASRIVSRAVRLSWPEDKVRFVVPCRLSRLAGATTIGPDGGGEGRVAGFLAVTDQHLVYQPRTCPGSLLRTAALLLAVFGAWALWSTSNIGTVVGFGIAWLLAALACWVVEVTSPGQVRLGFDQVLNADAPTRRIDAYTMEPGRLPESLRIWMVRPADFDAVVSRANGWGAANAA